MKEEIKAGIIVVASFFILSAFVILIGGSSFFEKVDKYTVRVMNAAGLETGAQVRLGGVRVGRILAIKEPTEPGKPVTIDVGLRGGTPIYKGTRASITQIGFVGDIYLLLSVDQTTQERMKPGEDIPAEESVEFSRMMAKLDGLSQSVDGLIKDVNKLFSPKNVHEIEMLIVNTNRAVVSGSSSIEKVASSLKSTTDKLQLVLNEVEDLVKSNKGEFAQLIKKAREDLDRAGDMIKSIEATAKTVDRTTGSVDTAINLQSRNLDNLLNTMTRTTEDLQDVLQDLKSKPWSVLYKEGRGE